MRVKKQLQLNAILEDWSLEHGVHVNISGQDMCDSPDRQRGGTEWDGHWNVGAANIRNVFTGEMASWIPYAAVSQEETVWTCFCFLFLFISFYFLFRMG